MSQSIIFMCFESDTEERNCCIIPSRRWWLPCELCKGKEIRENLSWLRQRFRVKHPQSPFSYNSDISRENQSCCSTQQLVQSWRCSDTRGFSMLPFIGFLADKSLDFWHGWRFWQWQVKTCRIRVQLCIGVGWYASRGGGYTKDFYSGQNYQAVSIEWYIVGVVEEWLRPVCNSK